ncbi:MAG: T9SS type A sorting domain-containing protein [Ignavibacteriaceae bacterium]|nr:T9SS type A sorting domain-containing protein [Ignavibacteriaceae bacterium]
MTDSLRIFFSQPLLDTIPNYVFDWAEQVSYLGFINNDSTPEIAFTVSGGWDPTGKIYVYSFEELNSVDDEKDIKLNKYVLYQNYPNPFNSSTIIKYSLPRQGEVKLSLYDLLGRLITTLVNEMKNTGEHQIELNTKNLSSGVYFYQLIAGNVILTNKLIF